MNTSPLFITEPGFLIARWSKAFPNAQVTDQRLPAEAQQLIWVLTGLPDWEETIRFYSRSGCKVIAMTRVADLEELRSALMAGARGYVDALSNTEILSQVAKTVNEGALWLPAPLVTSVIGIISSLLEKRQTQPADLSNLTEREREVTEAVVAGASNKEVAKQLQITERTVKAHLSNIFDKLGVRDRMHLMLAVRGKSS